MRIRTITLVITGLLASTILGYAAGAKAYQVTGPITDMTADSITVQKGSESWQINLPKGTKGATALKKGDKVTVYYTMTATEIESKAGAKKAEPKKEATPKKKAA